MLSCGARVFCQCQDAGEEVAALAVEEVEEAEDGVTCRGLERSQRWKSVGGLRSLDFVGLERKEM